MNAPPHPLAGKVALVAGATRGAGRGIATALGEAGATVYCAGRSARGHASPMARPETIDETAERVTRAGGVGIAVRADLSDEAQVRELVARIREEQGGLDVLVNDVWGGDALVEWGKPFWEMDMARGLRLWRQAIETHLLVARHAAPLLVARGGGLVVEVTDGDTYQYRGTFLYDLIKTTLIRAAFGMAQDLRPHGVAAVALTPGFLRSEAMLEHFGVTETTWREGANKDPNFIASETPLFVGRAVAALAADPDVMAKTGRVFASWTLSDEYGFSDADGSRPHWGRHFAATYGADAWRPLDDAFYAYCEPLALDPPS